MDNHTLVRTLLCACTLLAASAAPALENSTRHAQIEHRDADDGHADAAVADVAIEPGSIVVRAKRANSDDLAGALTTPSGALTFATDSTSAGKASAAGTTPERVMVTLEVNGAVIRHDFDVKGRRVTISTPEAVRFDQADLAVLRTFQQEFATARLSKENFPSMPRATELVWRLSEMYSEAPLDMTLEKLRVIDLSGNPEQYTDNDDVRQPAGGVLAKACAGQGGNGFIDLHDQGNVCDNGHLWRSEAHDYCSGPGAHHGYTTVSHYDFGCGAPSCAGRCGGGCGALNGQGAWQKDCLDHDRCNRTHGQQFEGCGDEWNEAADDYLNGEIHCIFDHCD
jgi:hypothetical protein